MLVLAGSGCTDRSPGGLGLPFPAALAITPAVTSVAGGPVFELVGVRVSLSGFPDDKPVIDTVVSFAAGDTALRLALTVRLMRPSQDFHLRVAAMDRVGDTLFRGRDTVTIRQSEASPVPTSVVLRYSGPDTLVAGISLAPRDTMIQVGVPLLMRAAAFAADQRMLTGVRFGWRTSAPATVTVAPDGTVLALAEVQGAWIIATTANGRTDSTRISAARVAQSLRITPDSATIGVGATLPLSVIAVDALGVEVSLTVPVIWSSESPRIASVSPTGVVTGLTAGTTLILAEAGTARGQMRVTVFQPL